MITPATFSTPALSGLFSSTALRMGGGEYKPWDVKQEGGQMDSGWGTETKPHTRDPKPTVLDPNDPKAKQTHIPKSESFEEYMKRRAAGGNSTPALSAMARGLTSLRMGADGGYKPWDVKQEGGQMDSGWGTDTKAHTRDPKEVKIDPNDPKSKQTYIPKSETFEEHMKRRAGAGK